MLDERKLRISLRALRSYLRDKMEAIIPGVSAGLSLDPALDLTRNMLLDQTIAEIDRSILQKYVRTQKLCETERRTFIKSIELMLTELSDYANVRNLVDYLAHFLPGGITVEDYREENRSQFEYATREARNLFSAKIKKMIIS